MWDGWVCSGAVWSDLGTRVRSQSLLQLLPAAARSWEGGGAAGQWVPPVRCVEESNPCVPR